MSIGIIFILNIKVKAQECKAYVPYKEGTKTEITTFDKKGKVTGISSSELKSIEKSANAVDFLMHVKAYDQKEKLIQEADLKFKCENGKFMMDMSSFLNSEQMKAYDDMDIKITSKNIYIPSEYKIGDVLDDGFVKVHVTSNATPINMDLVVNVVNRKIEAVEDVKTSSGTFQCVKVSEDIVTKSIMSFTVQSVEWYAEGVGVVKTETYHKGKLTGYSELTKFEEP